jgi:hypothetical protein
MTSPRVSPRLFSLVLAAALLCAVLVASSAAGKTSRPPRAHATSSYLTGIGDEQTTMFSNPLFQQLHTKIARYIAPYDAAVQPYDLGKAEQWIHDAEAQHIQVLVAFYHSEYTPTKLPSVAKYKHDVEKFVKLFPNVRQYQAFDESNRGNIPYVLSSPSASLDAQYYQALLRVCHRCTVIGLDVLDSANINPTLQYISEFKHEIGRLRTIMPKTWGLHNYSDVNRFETWRTRDLVEALGGQVWLTETGGIVKFAGDFTNYNGAGLTRAARALKLMFSLAGSSPQIKRLYIFDWSGGVASTRFDAGLTDAKGNPRPGYVVVCRALHAQRCSVVVSRH